LRTLPLLKELSLAGTSDIHFNYLPGLCIMENAPQIYRAFNCVSEEFPTGKSLFVMLFATIEH